MDEKTQECLRQVIEYLYEDERKHWIESGRPAFHIFHAVSRLDDWLAEVRG